MGSTCNKFNSFNKCLSWLTRKPTYQIIKKINYNDQNDHKEFFLIKRGKDHHHFFMKKVKKNILLFNFAKNEINIMKSLQHSNIIHVHDYSINEDLKHSILIIPYYEHNDLFHYAIDQGKSIDHFYLFEQLLDVLKYLKEQEVVHRDISLENIMIKHIDRDRLNIVLIDFEYAVYLHDDLNTNNPHMGGMIGKPKYVSPELSFHNVMKQKFGFGSDMWCLGNCFYALLTKKYLFKSAKEYFYLTLDDTFIKQRLEKDISDNNMIHVIMNMLKYYEKDRTLIENHPFFIQ